MGYEYSVELLVHGARESSLFDAVSCAALELGQEVYVVGGYVRDSVLGRANTDVDFVTVGSGVELARRVMRALRGPRLQVFKNFGAGSFQY